MTLALDGGGMMLCLLKRKGSPTPWKHLHLHVHPKESLQAGTEKLRLPEVYDQHYHTPKRAETHPAAPNTFTSHPLRTSWWVNIFVSMLMCGVPLCWVASPALQWVRRWAWLSPKTPSFLLPEEKAAIISAGPGRLKAQSTFTLPSLAFR